MRALITGSQGFVGRHLIRELQDHDWEIGGVDLAPAGAQPAAIDYFQADIRDARALEKTVRQFRPAACIHLSGLAFVPEGWANAEAVFSINTLGTIHLLEACRQFAPAAKILVVSSAEVYGEQTGQRLVTENDELAPANLYAVSKAAADQIARLYAGQYSLPAIVARPSNHIGPGQAPHFAVASFAAQLAAAAAQNTPAAIKVGNLDSVRDFTDVRDVARAYRLLIEKGRPGEAYNIASHREITLRHVLEQLGSIAGLKPVIEVDPARRRLTEPRARLATAKIETETNWKPQIAIETTLMDIMAEARSRVR